MGCAALSLVVSADTSESRTKMSAVIHLRAPTARRLSWFLSNRLLYSGFAIAQYIKLCVAATKAVSLENNRTNCLSASAAACPRRAGAVRVVGDILAPDVLALSGLLEISLL